MDELLAVKNRHYLELVGTAATAFPQMRAVVERLHTAGHPLAVASGSSRAAIDAALEATGLGSLLTVRVSAEEVGRGKPEPDVFLEAARLLGAAPAECVVVEDSAPGVEAARRAGMRCIAVPYVPDGQRPRSDEGGGPGRRRGRLGRAGLRGRPAGVRRTNRLRLGHAIELTPRFPSLRHPME